MRSWKNRIRYVGLLAASGGLFALNGCGLSDQQLAQVWQSVLTAGLNTVIGNAVGAAFGAV